MQIFFSPAFSTDPWFGISYNISENDPKTVEEVVKAYNTAAGFHFPPKNEFLPSYIEEGDDSEEGGDAMDVDEDGPILLGSDGLRLFYVKTDDDATLKLIIYLNIEHGLKNSVMASCYLASLNLALAAIVSQVSLLICFIFILCLN